MMNRIKEAEARFGFLSQEPLESKREREKNSMKEEEDESTARKRG